MRDKYIDEYKTIIEQIEALDDDGEAEANGGNIHVEESYMPDAVFFRYKGKTHSRVFRSASIVWRLIICIN